MNVCFISGAAPDTQDAVGDFAWLLAREVGRRHRVWLIATAPGRAADRAGAPAHGRAPAGPGETAPVETHAIHSGWGARALKEVLRVVRRLRPDAVVVHYVPQLYGWYGANPILPLVLIALRLQGHRIVTVAHEFTVPFGPSPKLALLAVVHRLYLRLILRASSRLVLTTALRLDLFERVFPSRRSDLFRIPIGSTVPVAPVDPDWKQRGRRGLGIAEGDLVVSTFGSIVGSRVGLLAEVLSRLVAEGLPVRILVLGKGGAGLRRRLAGDPVLRDRAVLTGPVSLAALSRHLSLSDLYLAFYEDGASTRRTSLMVPLAHGIPTVSNSGASTDPALAASGALHLLDVSGEPDARPMEAGLAALRRLCQDAGARRTLGGRAREFHEKHFSWTEIASQYEEVIEGSCRR